MADPRLGSSRVSSGAETLQRRKIRKGTQSCWECKRRKVKCTFAPPRGVTCDVCKRRGILCVGQEFPQSSTTPEQVGDRLDRVEALVEHLVKSTDSTDSVELPNGQTGGLLGTLSSSTGNNVDIPPVHETVHRLDQENIAGTTPPLKQADQREELCRMLVAAWPNECNLDIILSIPVDFAGCLHGLIRTPDSSAQSQKVASPREMLQLPPASSHPVLVARKLLILGSYLQAVPPCGVKSLRNLGVSHRDIMSRVVDTAHSLVNCNDELVASIEGVECITIESMYHNNAGNLRQAWLTLRRAMLIAQMMGLHRGRNPPSVLKTLEREMCISPEHVWFRLVQSDRYLSMMLGLPQGSPESNFFPTPWSLESCTPTERLQRIDCVVAGRILQRNEADINDLVATQEIDRLLHTASTSMPPQWWLIPNFASSASNKKEHFQETLRLMDQFTHYHLVSRLHLPYLLRSLADKKYEYSKITAVNASREILSRFVAFRKFNHVGSYCRGIDFLVFIASTTLCLAHIDAYRQRQSPSGDGNDGFFFSSLFHQRPTDRGMMELALESIEHMTSAGVDMIASKIAVIFRHLLIVEADAADGNQYNTSSFSNREEDLECSGRLSEGGNVLRIYIPYLGTIKIERGGVSRSDKILGATEPAASFPLPEGQVGHARPSVNMLDCPTRSRLSDQSISTDWQAVSWQFGQAFSGFNDDSAQVSQPLVSGLEVGRQGEEDWTLQGVDMALFDSLIRGSELDATEMSY